MTCIGLDCVPRVGGVQLTLRTCDVSQDRGGGEEEPLAKLIFSYVNLNTGPTATQMY